MPDHIFVFTQTLNRHLTQTKNNDKTPPVEHTDAKVTSRVQLVTHIYCPLLPRPECKTLALAHRTQDEMTRLRQHILAQVEVPLYNQLRPMKPRQNAPDKTTKTTASTNSCQTASAYSMSGVPLDLQKCPSDFLSRCDRRASRPGKPA